MTQECSQERTAQNLKYLNDLNCRHGLLRFSCKSPNQIQSVVHVTSFPPQMVSRLWIGNGLAWPWNLPQNVSKPAAVLSASACWGTRCTNLGVALRNCWRVKWVLVGVFCAKLITSRGTLLKYVSVIYPYIENSNMLWQTLSEFTWRVGGWEVETVLSLAQKWRPDVTFDLHVFPRVRPWLFYPLKAMW